MEPVCLTCNRTATKCCALCKTAAYCGKECQVAHWKEHAPECIGVRYNEGKYGYVMKELYAHKLHDGHGRLLDPGNPKDVRQAKGIAFAESKRRRKHRK